jgi:hypothetical protein
VDNYKASLDATLNLGRLRRRVCAAECVAAVCLWAVECKAAEEDRELECEDEYCRALTSALIGGRPPGR